MSGLISASSFTLCPSMSIIPSSFILASSRLNDVLFTLRYWASSFCLYGTVTVPSSFFCIFIRYIMILFLSLGSDKSLFFIFTIANLEAIYLRQFIPTFIRSSSVLFSRIFLAEMNKMRLSSTAPTSTQLSACPKATASPKVLPA